MGIAKKLYVAACRRWAPYGLTLSANAWRHAMETGDHSRRIRIDGLFMLLVKQQGHCHRQWQMETRGE